MLLSASKDINFDLILPKIKSASCEQVFIGCAQEMEKHVGISAPLLVQGLMSKKRLERSLVGEGLVISDMRVRGLMRPFFVLVTLDREVDFGAPDGLPVNVVSFLLSPESDGNLHLRRVFRLSRLLKNASLKQKLAEAQNEVEVRALLTHPEGWMIAA